MAKNWTFKLRHYQRPLRVLARRRQLITARRTRPGSNEFILINKAALRAIRRGGVKNLISVEIGRDAQEGQLTPGLWEVHLDSEAAVRIRRLAEVHGLTLSEVILRLSTGEIQLT